MSAAWGQFTLLSTTSSPCRQYCYFNLHIFSIRNRQKTAHFHQKYWPGPCDYNDDIKDDDDSDDNDDNDDNDGHMVETALCNLGRNVGSCLDWNSQNTKIPGHLKFRSWSLFYFQTLLSYHFQKHWRNFKVVFIEIKKVKIHFLRRICGGSNAWIFSTASQLLIDGNWSVAGEVDGSSKIRIRHSLNDNFVPSKTLMAILHIRSSLHSVEYHFTY